MIATHSPARAQPALFLSHGSPMMALRPGKAGAAIAALGEQLPRPDAILVISAHWCTDGLHVGTQAQPPQIRDFYGFPPELGRVEYPAPGAPELAGRVLECLRSAGMPAIGDDSWGLDHGSWVPLRQMYPAADIPVTQLSLPVNRTPAELYRLGQALAPLAGEGILIVASGCMTHNLGDIHRGADGAYAERFGDWVVGRVLAGDVEALFDYRRRAPDAVRAHPTDEHLLPLFVAMGAGAGGATRWVDAGTEHAVLRMDGFVFGLQAKDA